MQTFLIRDIVENTWLQEVDRIKVGIVSQDELDVGKKMQGKILDYLPDFEWHLKTKQATANHIFSTISRIKKVCLVCHFDKMTDLNADVLLRWLQTQTDEGIRIILLLEDDDEVIGKTNQTALAAHQRLDRLFKPIVR